MAFIPKLEEGKKLSLTALFDVVFLLIIFFIVTTTPTGGGEDILGKKDIDTPREAGDTSSHILVQLFQQNDAVHCLVIGKQDDLKIKVLKRSSLDVHSKSSLISAFRYRKISFASLADLDRVVRGKINEYNDSQNDDKPNVAIALRTEYNIKYVDVIKTIDILTSKGIGEIANIKYVLLMGSIERINDQRAGLLGMIEFGDQPDPPREVSYIPTPGEKRF